MSDSPTRTASEVIDSAPMGRLQIAAVTLCILVSLIDGFDTQALAFVAPSILREWGLSPLLLGLGFSGTLLGAAVGSSVCGYLADKFGRRWLIILPTLLFALFTLACSVANSFNELLLFRFLAGVGLGGVIPNMIALASEYAPTRSRATITVITLWGFPMGAVVGGLAAAPLIEAFGWRSIFVVGGLAPLALAFALIALLPESLRFLALQDRHRQKAVALLRKISPTLPSDFRLAPEPQQAKSGFLGIFQLQYLPATLLLSSAIFFSLFLSYILVSWVPSILTAAGMTLRQGIWGAVALNFGGVVGSFVLSRVLDKTRRGALVLGAGYACAAIGMTLLSAATHSPALALAMLGACGFFHIGSQLTVAAFGAAEYPVAMRGAGVGFQQFIGRIGSLLGPTSAGMLLSAGGGPTALFDLAFAPALAAAGCMLLFALFSGRQRARAKQEE